MAPIKVPDMSTVDRFCLLAYLFLGLEKVIFVTATKLTFLSFNYFLESSNKLNMQKIL